MNTDTRSSVTLAKYTGRTTLATSGVFYFTCENVAPIMSSNVMRSASWISVWKVGLMWISVAIHSIFLVAAISLFYMHQGALEIVLLCMAVVTITGSLFAANDTTDVYLDMLDVNPRSIEGARV
jgi:hypothetical protein